MELWGWLVGYVVLFALLHLLLYYAYVRRGSDDGSPMPSFADGNRAGTQYSSSSDGYSGSGDDTDAEPEFDGETIRCPHCGVRNDADKTYTYCWNCISTLRQ
ncbi:DUF7577 domain-containing protein [Natrialbaceae archaeon AArc-T1-2]|uniref:DUF7577 domain-containing protein n=1 Tax=Natrialbaceae archaeon AArc-T1-2 TaxID=3053904 RepID=UPI00255ACAB5|nr:hypothetical protein [Natrialbaceae archaeon AArc-T1-2]WIV68063.1 hypothetical protein QQ977_04850 [Natrialbaceae archaeon AArc-T1-2]